MNYHWNWLMFWAPAPDGTGTYLHTLIRGMYWTLGVSVLAWVIALVFGVAVGVLRTAKIRGLERLCAGYVELFRNVPLLVQMFLWYFVVPEIRSEEHTSELQSLMRISYAVFCLKNKK